MTKKEIKFNTLENEILEWLKDLKKVFETIFERELLSRRHEVNYEIILKIKKIKSSSLISTRSKEQEIVKECLNEIIRKEWIRINKLFIITFLFLILKPETNEKQLVIDYRKLNEETVTDSTSLSLIKDMMDQIKE